MKATCLVCTLKRSPEPSNSESLAEVVLGALREEGVETDVIRLADHQIDPGVVSEAVSEGDEWPAIRERILDAEILIVALPTWLGQPSSVSKRALERMDAFLSETKRGRLADRAGSRRRRGRRRQRGRRAPLHLRGQRRAQRHRLHAPRPELDLLEQGPGPGEEEWLTTDEREWSTETGKACASNLLRTARALAP